MLKLKNILLNDSNTLSTMNCVLSSLGQKLPIRNFTVSKCPMLEVQTLEHLLQFAVHGQTATLVLGSTDFLRAVRFVPKLKMPEI